MERAGGWLVHFQESVALPSPRSPADAVKWESGTLSQLLQRQMHSTSLVVDSWVEGTRPVNLERRTVNGLNSHSDLTASVADSVFYWLWSIY